MGTATTPIGHAGPDGPCALTTASVGPRRKIQLIQSTEGEIEASEADFAEAKPILDAAAEKIFHLGPLGNGMRATFVQAGAVRDAPANALPLQARCVVEVCALPRAAAE